MHLTAARNKHIGKDSKKEETYVSLQLPDTCSADCNEFLSLGFHLFFVWFGFGLIKNLS